MAFSISRAMTGLRESGEPLPFIKELAPLYKMGVNFRRDQVICIAGRPGSQKSGFVTWLCTQWNLPTLYFSADMDPFTATTRVGGIFLEKTSAEIADIMNRDPASNPETLRLQEASLNSNLQFVFDGSPSIESMNDELEAWLEINDDYPAIIVVDNLLDVQGIAEDQRVSDLNLLLAFKDLARDTNSLVIVLHHNKEAGDPAFPAPADGLQGKVSQPLALLLSIALAHNDENTMPFRVACVKNRTGAQDPTGKRYAELVAEPAKTLFRSVPDYYQKVQGG